MKEIFKKYDTLTCFQLSEDFERMTPEEKGMYSFFFEFWKEFYSLTSV